MAAADVNGGAVPIVPFDPSAGHRTRCTGRRAEPRATRLGFEETGIAFASGCSLASLAIAASSISSSLLTPAAGATSTKLRPTSVSVPVLSRKNMVTWPAYSIALNVTKEDTSARGAAYPGRERERHGHPRAQGQVITKTATALSRAAANPMPSAYPDQRRRRDHADCRHEIMRGSFGKSLRGCLAG